MINLGLLLRPTPVNRKVRIGSAIKITANTAARGQYAIQAGAADAGLPADGLPVIGAAMLGRPTGADCPVGSVRAAGVVSPTGDEANGSTSSSDTVSTSKMDAGFCLLTTSCKPS